MAMKGLFLSTLRFCALVLCLLSGAAWADPGAWREALAPRTWQFPADLGAHPAYRTEWWYFTGNLTDGGGNRYGYDLTFFREGIRPQPADPRSPWSLRDLYLAHFTVTDAAKRHFFMDERVSRRGPGLAGARTDGLDVHLLDWSAKQEGKHISLRAKSGRVELSLLLTPEKPPVLHGEKGLSRKGPAPGQASYYVSSTDLRTAGSLREAAGEAPVVLGGASWFDHEFGSNQLAPDQAGWDWFGLHLSDGRDLMFYGLRRIDGTFEPASSGTMVDARGRGRFLPLSAVRVEVLDHWRSPKSGASYPSRWRISVPAGRLDLLVRPILADQELVTGGSTGVTYWEGAVEGRGTSAGQPITCTGYVELTGYAGRLGGLF
jgi:predicted secreted hydrolase